MGRESMIGRIREALRTPSPEAPRARGPVAESGTPLHFRAALPPAATVESARIEMFAAFAVKLRAEFHVCADLDEARQRLLTLAKEGDWTRLATHGGALADTVMACLPPSISILRTDGGYDREALAACNASVTECDCLVAQTGSVCVTSRSAGGRALTVLPPHHIVIARRSQLLGDLCDAYALLAEKYAAAWPGFLGFITGPSRTGDIERILVFGAHGPRRLNILLVP